jgi:hypothetical protein
MELKKFAVCRDIIGERIIPAPRIPSPVDPRVIETVSDIQGVARLSRISIIDQETLSRWGAVRERVWRKWRKQGLDRVDRV